MSKITIIMPSLNVRNYIRPCIESVLTQTLEDIDILSIDAGSTDGTLEILEEYAAADDRLQVIHADKKSYGYQVNLGIESANSEYIGIVETDDIIASNMYERLYQTAAVQNLEYVKGGFVQFVETLNGLRWNQSGCRCISDMNLIGKCISPKSMPELATQDYYLWAGIYRKDFLKDIRLTETSGAAFQDTGFIYQVLSKAERAMYIMDELYYYRQTTGNSTFNKNGFHYLIVEYTNMKRLTLRGADIWKQAYYERLFRQTVGRFQRMVVSGQYWDEAEEDIRILQDMMKQGETDGNFMPDKLDEENRRIYLELQENPRAFFDSEHSIFCLKTEKLQVLLDSVGDRNIVIFGCGKYGKYIHVLLECHIPGQVCAFCDNDTSLWNTTVQGIQVLNPKETVKQYQDCDYIIANARNLEEIRAQLVKLGIMENRVYNYQPDFDMRLFLV